MKTKQPELNKITALYERLSRNIVVHKADKSTGDRICPANLADLKK